MKVVVLTNDNLLWAVQPFAYLFNTYWSAMQPVVVMGYNPPQFNLPRNFQFASIDNHNYPANRWTDGLMRFLERYDEDLFVLMLEDYWLCRGVNHQAVQSLGQYMQMNPDILRIDLTGDRLHSGKGVDVDTWGYVDLIETARDTPYQWSTQACIVRTKHMLKCLRPSLAPWEFELQGNELIPEGLRVLGTRQYPVRYINAVGMQLDKKYRYRTEHIREGHGGKTVERIPKEHVDEMLRRGILPPRER